MVDHAFCDLAGEIFVSVSTSGLTARQKVSNAVGFHLDDAGHALCAYAVKVRPRRRRFISSCRHAEGAMRDRITKHFCDDLWHSAPEIVF